MASAMMNDASDPHNAPKMGKTITVHVRASGFEIPEKNKFTDRQSGEGS